MPAVGAAAIMASFEPIDHFDHFEPPPRPTTPPVRRGFLMVLGILCILALLVYGVPSLAERTGYAWEAGRSRAASEALAKLNRKGIINEASALFRMATVKVAPAVVNIQHIRGARLRGGIRFGPGEVESGSGFVVDRDRGYIVTNNHVVEGSGEIIVRFGPGQQMIGRIVGSDPKTDLAVVKVDGPLKVAAEWGDSDTLDIGDWVLAIGSPLNLDRTVTAGIVSATGRRRLGIVGEGSYEDFIQTDAALNPGNSGGPLIDLNGRVVGVNTAIISQSGGDQGLGLAISAKLAKKVVDDLIQHGRAARGYLGVSLEDIGPADVQRLNLADAQGALVAQVEPDSPAERAGLKSGDVIIKVGDRAVSDLTALRLSVAELPSGTRTPLTIIRDGQTQTVEAVIGELPVLLGLGARLRLAAPEEAAQFPDQPEQAVIVAQVEPGSPAFRARLRPGMRILAVDGRPVQSPSEVNQLAAKADVNAGIPLQIQLPDGRTGQITVGGPSIARSR
jgi:serine protease Do